MKYNITITIEDGVLIAVDSDFGTVDVFYTDLNDEYDRISDYWGGKISDKAIALTFAKESENE